MTVRLVNPTAARDVKPGDKIQCFSDWYWVRYINYHGSHPSLTLRLQPEDEPLSPFYENDRITVTVPNDLIIDVEVI